MLFTSYFTLQTLVVLSISFSNSWTSLSCCAEAQNTAELDQETQKLLEWSPPYDVKKSFPYFLTGYDYEGCPVWVIEYGKWDIRTFLETKSVQDIEDFDQYIRQAIARMYYSHLNASTPDRPVDEFVLIEDAEGFNRRQFSHPKTVSKAVFIVSEFILVEQKRGRRLKQAYSINNNFVANSVWALLAPVMGELATRIQVFGTNAERWKVTLARELPKEALPSWMGGFTNATPIKIYG